ncbi:MAG: pseudaminic acid cytidylyltransferase [Lachnospiraceae bacterium]
MNRLAMITARGGSKRIPKKNIKDFCGKPIIAYSIEAALESGIFDEVMVSTDSEEIAEIARQYGANIPFMRSTKTASDYATSADVMMEVIDNYKKLGMEFDSFVCIYPTAPFITGKKLKEAVNILEEQQKYEVIPVVGYSYPPQRGYVINMCNDIEMKYPEFRSVRSQDLEKIYHDAGQFYCLNTRAFLEKKGIVDEKIAPYIVSEMEVQDIDNYDDWKIAELKYQLLCNVEK